MFNVFRFLLHRNLFDCPIWWWFFVLISTPVQMSGIMFAVGIEPWWIYVGLFAILNVMYPISGIGLFVIGLYAYI